MMGLRTTRKAVQERDFPCEACRDILSSESPKHSEGIPRSRPGPYYSTKGLRSRYRDCNTVTVTRPPPRSDSLSLSLRVL